MGSVWRAEHVQWNAPIALKLVNLPVVRGTKTSAGLDEGLRQRFLSEVKAAAAIRSSHVVQILDHGIDPVHNQPYIAMELLEGETLEARLERQRRLSFAETSRLLGQVAKALSRLHEANLVHRDLKPGNVFIVHDDGDELVKVLDFGIVKSAEDLDQEPITATGEQIGTPFYMSPDQIRGTRDIDFRTDIWAFGVIAFECVTGVRPFQGVSLGDLSLKICAEPIPSPSRFADVPAGFDDWFHKCVHRDRELTFASAREAAEALRAALQTNGGQPTASPDGVRERDFVLAETALLEAAEVFTGAPVSAASNTASRSRKTWVATGLLALGAAAIVGYLKVNAGPDQGSTVAPGASASPKATASPAHPITDLAASASANPELTVPAEVVNPTAAVSAAAVAGSLPMSPPSRPKPAIRAARALRGAPAPAPVAPQPPSETRRLQPNDLIENRH